MLIWQDLLIDLKRLKQRQEIEAEMERSAAPDSISRSAIATSGGQAVVATSIDSAGQTGQVAAPSTTSSAEYLVSQIKRHKRRALLALAMVVVAVAGIVYFVGRGNEKPIDSIAVLPFVNQNNDPNTEYLSDGIPESIINSLSQLPNLKVMSRNSVFLTPLGSALPSARTTAEADPTDNKISCALLAARAAG